jgi:UDP-GlcNAc3NAcA epimerase
LPSKSELPFSFRSPDLGAAGLLPFVACFRYLMKILTVVGARPQFIKHWPVSAALRRTGCAEFLLHTGQHYDADMSERFFTELDLRPPDANLGIGSGSHGEQTGRMLAGIETHLVAQKPDWILVYGDTNSTLAGALAAAKLGLPVAHVEAGLRSFNRRMPEEINRVLTDHLSSRLFCPSPHSIENLVREGISAGVSLVGDVMFDALRHFRAVANARSDALAKLRLSPEHYYLATIHRAENTDDPARLLQLLETLATLDRPVVLPLHPRTRAVLGRNGCTLPTGGLRVLEPLGYLDMLALTQAAAAILTDSGGLQKEAYWLGVRCITLRAETEWVETLTGRWNQLAGTDPGCIRAALTRAPQEARQPFYGSGDAAERIANELVKEQS